MDAVEINKGQNIATSQRSASLGRIVALAAVCLGLFQAGRLFWFIDRYSVDVPYWDQWDFYKAFFTPHSLWQIFAWQHGPHRQGVGFFLTWMVNELTDWNQRAQCFTIGLVMIAAALAALWLKRRLFGSLRWYDLIIVLFVLSLRQWEMYAATPNVSHGAMPLLLIILSCIAWTIGNMYLRYALVLILGFLATYTGFGLFVGAITPLLLAADLWHAFQRRSRGGMVAAGVAVAVSLLSLGSFFCNHHSRAGAVVFPDPNWQLYPVFMALQFAGLAGVLGTGWVTITVGLLVLTGIVALAVWAAIRLFWGSDKEPLPRIVLLLAGFALVFSATSAIGRLRLGLDVAASSRYFPLLATAAVAAYLCLLGRPAGRLRQGMLLILLAWTLAATMPFAGRDEAAAICDAKTRWVAAYLQTRDVQTADRMASFQIHPNPVGRGVGEKLQWLAAHRYSLFRAGVRHEGESPSR